MLPVAGRPAGAIICLVVVPLVLSPASSARSHSGGELRGVVTTKSVGPIPFGATIVQVRTWAGPPDFSSPPLRSYPIPRHDPGTVVLGYECKGFGRHVCHTLFAFAKGHLVNFMTESRLFTTAHGARPGMSANEATRHEPQLAIVRGCPSWAGTKVPVLAATTEQQGRLYSLYARTPARSPAFGPHC